MEIEDLVTDILDEAQQEWEDNYTFHTQRRLNPKGIRSSQLSALLTVLIRRDMITIVNTCEPHVMDREDRANKLLLAAILLNRHRPLSQHHAAVIREKLHYMDDEKLEEFIRTGKFPAALHCLT